MSFKEELGKLKDEIKKKIEEINKKFSSLEEIKSKIKDLQGDDKKKMEELYNQVIRDIMAIRDIVIKDMWKFILENEGFRMWRNILTDYLQEKIKNNQIDYKEFEKAVDEYRELAFELEKILEFAMRISQGKIKENMNKLYSEFTKQNISNMYETLYKLGYRYRSSKDEKDKKIVSAFEDQSFRIMEKTRHGLRSEVEYMIMRIFVVNKKEIPRPLSKAFNPIYPDEIFKTFIYSFLSGILGETKEGGE